MNVTSTQTVSSASVGASYATSPATGTNSLGYNDFLSLLLAEMKNQDPTQPMDTSQMVSQLATVSQVGQAVQTNTTLTSMLASTTLAQAEQMVGKTLSSGDGSQVGIVQSVTVNSSGIVANLENGSQIPVSGALTIGR